MWNFLMMGALVAAVFAFWQYQDRSMRAPGLTPMLAVLATVITGFMSGWGEAGVFFLGGFIGFLITFSFWGPYGQARKMVREATGTEPVPNLWYGSKGRINRKTFLLVEIIAIALGSLGFLAAYQIDGFIGTSIFWPLFIVGFGINISALIRRLHDLGLSGFFVFIWWIPTVGQILWLALFILPGKGRVNGHGPEPHTVGVASFAPINLG